MKNEEEQSDSSMDRLEEHFGQDLEIPSEVEEEIKKKEREIKDLKKKEIERKELKKKELERKELEKKELERKELKKQERERKEREKKELERKEGERRRQDPKREDEKEKPAPRSSAPPPPAEAPHWIREGGTLKPFKEIHQLSQRSEEGSSEVYVSCLRCQHIPFGPMLRASAVILTMPLRAGDSRPKRERRGSKLRKLTELLQKKPLERRPNPEIRVQRQRTIHTSTSTETN